MKKLILLFCVMLVGCGVEYQLGEQKVVPDSLKTKYSDFILESVKNASNQLTTSDYEDPEDVLRQAEITGKNIWGVNKLGLDIRYTGQYWVFKSVEELDSAELVIYQELRKQQ